MLWLVVLHLKTWNNIASNINRTISFGGMWKNLQHNVVCHRLQKERCFYEGQLTSDFQYVHPHGFQIEICTVSKVQMWRQTPF